MRHPDVMDAGDDFASYAAARWPTLVRSAVLLGCSATEAEDVAQETLVRCLVSWRRVTAARHRDAYVSTILLNAFRDSRRRPWRRERSTSDLPEVTMADVTAASDDADAVTSALRSLSVGQREVLVLRFYAFLTEAQTAEALGIALGTVKSRTARALQLLATDANLTALRDGGFT